MELMRTLSCLPLRNMCFQNSREIAFNLVCVILCEPVNVETESRNFSAFKAFTDANKTIMILPVPIFFTYVHKDITVLILGFQTVHEDSNNVNCFKYK